MISFGKPPNTNISILDFGGASLATEPREHCCTPIINQAPEALVGEAGGQPADVWAFGCTVFALFDNTRLFEVGMANESDILSEIVDALGRLPQHLWDKWKWRSEHYEEDGTKKLQRVMPEFAVERPLALRVERMRSMIPPSASEAERLSAEDKAGIRQLLKACFEYKTQDRITAEEILELDWIKKLRAEYEIGDPQMSEESLYTKGILPEQRERPELRVSRSVLGGTNCNIIKHNPQLHPKARSKSV